MFMLQAWGTAVSKDEVTKYLNLFNCRSFSHSIVGLSLGWWNCLLLHFWFDLDLFQTELCQTNQTFWSIWCIQNNHSSVVLTINTKGEDNYLSVGQYWECKSILFHNITLQYCKWFLEYFNHFDCKKAFIINYN